MTRIWSITCEPCACSHPPPGPRVGPPLGHLRGRIREHADVEHDGDEAGLADRARSRRCARASPARDPSGTRCRAGARCPPVLRPRERTCASVTSLANGFSQITCFPAAIAASVISACVCGGVATVTASTSASASASPSDVNARGTSNALRAFNRTLRIPTDDRAHLEPRCAQRAYVRETPEARAEHDDSERVSASGGHVTCRAVSCRPPRRSRRSPACSRSSPTAG